MNHTRTTADIAEKTALLGILSAQAVAVSFLEGLIPPFLPVAGMKPGFSNIVTMFACSSLGVTYAFFIVIFKALFALLTRGATAFFMSIAGGILSLAVMALIFRLGAKGFGLVGTGIASALAHNAGQLIVARFILGDAAWSLAPLLILTSVLAGGVTGIILKIVLPVLEKEKSHFLHKKH
ncbi:MAG: Gx transporter family protein [Clostridiales bacterium]|nr:Gx transporter family protein [Clostridiales bacterium]